MLDELYDVVWNLAGIRNGIWEVMGTCIYSILLLE